MGLITIIKKHIIRKLETKPVGNIPIETQRRKK